MMEINYLNPTEEFRTYSSYWDEENQTTFAQSMLDSTHGWVTLNGISTQDDGTS
jgi:hypothetical protein